MVSLQRPELGFRIPNSFMALLLIVILLGFSGVIPDISSWGHLGGLIVGLLLGVASANRR
jgi:membrane associated rhomboid family serine protease